MAVACPRSPRRCVLRTHWVCPCCAHVTCSSWLRHWGTSCNHNEHVKISEKVQWRMPLTNYSPSKGSHLYVACWSICDHDQVFDRRKVCLIAWSVPPEALDHLIFKGQRSNCSHVLDCWFLAAWKSPWSLDRSPKRALVTWFNFDLGCKCFYMGHKSDSLFPSAWCFHEVAVQRVWTPVLLTH